MGAIFAVLAAFGLAVGAILSRRGGMRINPVLGARVTVFVGVPVFLVLALASGEIWSAGSMTATAYVLFGLSGVTHFILGRSLQYIAVRKIGATRATVIITLAPLITAVFGVLIFGDDPTRWILIGGALVIAGPVLMAQGEARSQDTGIEITPGELLARQDLRQGVVMSVLAALAWGFSPVLVKAGLNRSDYPVLATFVAYVTAAAFVAGYFSLQGERESFRKLDTTGVYWFIGTGLAVSIAHFFRYTAFSRENITIVSLMMQTAPLFVYVLTLTVNRAIESVSPYVLLGGAFVLVGATVIAVGG